MKDLSGTRKSFFQKDIFVDGLEFLVFLDGLDFGVLVRNHIFVDGLDFGLLVFLFGTMFCLD